MTAYHVEEAVAPAHEGLGVDVLVVLEEVESALEPFVDDAAIVLSREPELGLDGGAEQRPPELVEPLALHHHAGGRTLEGLEVRHRDAHVLQPQRLDGLEAEDVADDRRGQVRDRSLLEEIEVVGDEGEVLVGRTGHRIDPVTLGAIVVAGGQAVGPHHRPGRGRGLARHRGAGLDRVDPLLRRDPEEGEEVRLLGQVVRLPVTHQGVGNDAGLVSLFAAEGFRHIETIGGTGGPLNRQTTSPELSNGQSRVPVTSTNG